MGQKIKVLMCGSDLKSVKGGMVTVARNYLVCDLWEKSDIHYISTHREGGKVAKSFWFAFACIRILAILILRRTDVVHLHVAERGSFYRKSMLVIFCKRFHIPVILHHHGAEFEDFYEKLRPSLKKYVKRILEEADLNLVLSKELQRRLLQKASDARVEVLNNAVNAKDKNPYLREGHDRILMLGIQGKRKGSYDLLEALAEIENRLPANLKVWMCGDGEIEQIKERALHLGLDGRVEHIGWIFEREREECFSRAIMHVLPSYREALPMSILETMGNGIPNISTSVASIPEVIKDGENGYLIEPGDIKRLGECILKLACDERLRKEFSVKSHALIKRKFSLEVCVVKLEQLYQELYEKSKRRLVKIN